MLEYDKKTISRILKLEGFDLEKFDLTKIKHVPMHEYRVSSKEKPLLLIENLQVCIGLYAYSKNFGFAAHLNPVVIEGNEFECDKSKNITHCNRIEDLFNSIVEAKPKEMVYIGISLGFCPCMETYQQTRLIDNSIDILISKLKIIGINSTKLNLRFNHILILDTENDKIIVPSTENTKTK